MKLVVVSYAPLGSVKKKTSRVVAYPIGREISKSRHLLRRLMPNDDDFSLFFFFFHFYFPDGEIDFSLKSAKFGHKMTLKSPPFDFQEVTETLMLYKF